VEAIALTLPSGGGNNSMLGGIGGTLSSGNIDYNSTSVTRFDDCCIKELAFDLGVDPRVLKSKLQSIIGSSTYDH
jgi:hypothetical protein